MSGDAGNRDTWDVAQYGCFADLRLRPALDLISAIPDISPDAIADLGCGPGSVTMLLAERWPNAAVCGIDGSSRMLAEARKRDPGGRVLWREGDIADWTPNAEGLVFSNAALHWLGDHEALLTGWLSAMTPGAVMAFQVPDNFSEPSHEVMREVADDPAWRARLKHIADRLPVAEPDRYRKWLGACCRRLDVWQTVYRQTLEGDNPVFEWMKGAGMRPYLAALGGGERAAFEERCRVALAAAYPKAADDTTAFPFRRLFAVAVR